MLPKLQNFSESGFLKTLLAGALLLLVGHAADGAAVWTNKAGHGLAATPVAYQDAVVTFLKDTGQKVKIPISVFNRESQKLLADYLETHGLKRINICHQAHM